MSRVMTMANMPSLSASIRFLPISNLVASICTDIPLLACSGLARLNAATARTVVHFLDHAAEVGIEMFPVVGRNRIHQLVGVMVHLRAALRANHFVSLL